MHALLTSVSSHSDVYYQASNIDNRITNPDQLLTQDVERWCGSVVDLYSNLAKPVLDMAVYTYRLSHTIGLQVRTVRRPSPPPPAFLIPPRLSRAPAPCCRTWLCPACC